MIITFAKIKFVTDHHNLKNTKSKHRFLLYHFTVHKNYTQLGGKVTYVIRIKYLKNVL